MAKLSPRKFTMEDFKENQSWIGKLLSPLNDFFQQIYQGWNNGLTIQDNLFQEIKEIKFKVDSTTYPLRFKTKFSVIPKGMTVIYCKDESSSGPSESPWIDWNYNNGLVTINNITGLTSGLTYTLRIHVIYE